MPPALPIDAPAAHQLLRTVLNVSLTAINLLHPRYAAAGGELVDFFLDYLNPAAQRMTGLAEQPGGTMQERFPETFTNGVFAFYRRVFETGEAGTFAFNYQADGFDNYFQVAAWRHEAQLVVSFTDTADHPRTAVEMALRESQARERAARAEAEARQADLTRLFEQSPVAMAVFRGSTYVVELANAEMGRIWGRSPAQTLGRPVFEALPDIVNQGFEALFAEVLHHGKSYDLQEVPVTIDRGHTERPPLGYFNLTYRPQYDVHGTITGLVTMATEVTEQVLARQQVQQLNDELEVRVTARSAEARAAQHEAEHQRELLRTQQQLLSQILGQVPAAIATLQGPAHRYTFFNEGYQALVAGRTALGLKVSEVLPEMAEQGFIALLDQVYATGQPFKGTDTPIMLHDQATGQAQGRYLDFLYQPLFDGQAQPRGILAFIVDVTDRVQSRKQADTLQAAMLGVAKRQAQERQELYQLFEQTPVAIVLLREPNHRIDYFNPAFAALFPLEGWAEPLLHHTLAEVYPRIQPAGLLELMDRVFTTGESQSMVELPLEKLYPGSPRYVTFAYQAYREQDCIVGVAAFIYDVTEQVLARQAVEAQRTAQQVELQRIFAQAPVAIAILRGPELVIELANAAVETIWGRPAAQVLGQPYFTALPETAGQGFELVLAEVLRTAQPFFVTEAPVRLPQAAQPREAYVNFVFQPLFDEQQRTTGLLALGVEVTEQVLARQQVQHLNEELHTANHSLNATNEQLTRTNTDLDTFVYTASHDLKAPINNIEGLVQALRTELPAEVLQGPLVARLLDLIEGSIDRFLQTIGHLTDLTYLQHAEAPETVDLAALIEGVRLDLAPLLEASLAALTVTVEGCEAVRMGPKTLRSVVYNLLSNALKYRAPDRSAKVQVRAHCTADQVVLAVQDNGLGLSENQQRDLFGLFRRLHTHVEGAGVGLFTVKRLVENVGGTITVQSQLAVGTTFTVSLPI